MKKSYKRGEIILIAALPVVKAGAPTEAGDNALKCIFLFIGVGK
jgi:hypothetical protein